MLFEFFINALYFLDSSQLHPILPESIFSPLANIRYFLHGLDGVDIHFSVIYLGLVHFALELENAVLAQLLVIYFTGGFGPGKFSWVVFGFEVLVAFGSAEPKCFTVVSDKHHAVPRVDWARTEVAFFNPHCSTTKYNYSILTHYVNTSM